MYLDKKEILSSLNKDDIILILTSLGSLPPKDDKNGGLVFQTICHNPPSESNSWKLYYYLPDDEHEYGLFHCYSGCQDSFDLIELVIRANRVNGKQVNWYKALYYIGQTTGKLKKNTQHINNKVIATEDDFKWIRRINRKKASYENGQLPEINENVLEMFYYVPYQDWLDDHISREALNRFEIGYYGLTNQITIPHRDKDNRLVGVRGRYLDKNDVTNIGKYAPLCVNGKFLAHSLGKNLYGINVVQNKIKQCHKVMLVESEKAVMQSYSYFGDDSFTVAVCGSSITKIQEQILLKDLCVSEIIIAFDKEYKDSQSFEAEKYYKKLLKKVKGMIPYCKVSLILDTENKLEYKQSPTDRGKETLLELMKNKIVVTKESYQ